MMKMKNWNQYQPEMIIKFTYNWNLSDLEAVPKNGRKVFSTFACGGGSTMGYKMSGFDVIGANEIDPAMASIYKTNHNPKYLYVEDIRKFRNRDDLPNDFKNLDILDGSPPCSSFSMSGSREKQWSKKKKFREGQQAQILDDLFFDFIELTRKLQPKVAVAENVKGMIQGNAKGYVKQIIGLFNVAGYDVQLFLLNGATMGLPQRRERVFFVCRRKDLNLPKLKIAFNERPIPLREAFSHFKTKGKDRSMSKNKFIYDLCKPGDAFSKHHRKGSLFNWSKLSPSKPAPTVAATNAHLLFHWESMRQMSLEEICAVGSFPQEYKFKNENQGAYQIGMSVPPLMMHKLSEQIYKQWFQE